MQLKVLGGRGEEAMKVNSNIQLKTTSKLLMGRFTKLELFQCPKI